MLVRLKGAPSWWLYAGLALVCAGEWWLTLGPRSPYALGNADYWMQADGYRLHYDAIGFVDLANYFAGRPDVDPSTLIRAGRPVLGYLGALLAPYVGTVNGLLVANLVIWWLTAVYTYKWAALWLAPDHTSSAGYLPGKSARRNQCGKEFVPDHTSSAGCSALPAGRRNQPGETLNQGQAETGRVAFGGQRSSHRGVGIGRRGPAALAALLVAAGPGLRVVGGTPVPDLLAMGGSVLVLYAVERLMPVVAVAEHVRPRACAGNGVRETSSATKVDAQRVVTAAATGLLLGWVLLGKEAYHLAGFLVLWAAWRRLGRLEMGALAGVAAAVVAGWYALALAGLRLPTEPGAAGGGGLVERLGWWRETLAHPLTGDLGELLRQTVTGFPVLFGWAFVWAPLPLAALGFRAAGNARRLYATLYVLNVALLLFLWRSPQPPRLFFLAFPVVYALAALGVAWLAARVSGALGRVTREGSAAWLPGAGGAATWALAAALCVVTAHLDVYRFVYYG